MLRCWRSHQPGVLLRSILSAADILSLAFQSRRAGRSNPCPLRGGTSRSIFLPKLKLSWFLGGTRAGPHPKNLLFFGDIASVTVQTLEQQLPARYYPEKDEFRN